MSYDPFPPSYAPAPAKAAAYATLLAAKQAWLRGKIAGEQDLIRAARDGLRSKDDQVRSDAEQQIDQYEKDIAEARAELAKLAGPRNQAQEAVLKKNLQAWLDALQVQINYWVTAAENAEKRATEKGKDAPSAPLEKDRATQAADGLKREKGDLEKDGKDAGLL